MSTVTRPTPHARQPEDLVAFPGSGAEQESQHAKPWWWVMLTTALLGIASGTITVVEKITILKDPTQSAFCDFNDTIGCTPVLLAPQSSILGPPNAAIGIVLFGMFAAAGLGGVMGARYPRSYRWVLLGLAVFFGAFLTWYMWQVGFAIGSLCPFCAVCAGCVMAIVLASARVLAADTPDQATGPARALSTARRAGLDVIVVVGWTVLIAGILIVGIGT